MATLKIRKSENEVIELPLTTEKPIARSLAVFQDGKVYYCPLVHSGDYLDSGVQVHINGTDYALATQIYDPLLHDSSGETWTKKTAYDSPDSNSDLYINYTISEGECLFDRGYITIDGPAQLKRDQPLALSSDAYFEFQCNIIRHNLYGSESPIIFSLCKNSLNSLVLRIEPTVSYPCITSAQQYNSNNIKARMATKISYDEMYSVGFIYDNGTIKLMCNEEWTDTVNFSITNDAQWKLSIGSGDSISDTFYGKISNVRIRSSVEGVSNLLFGD